MLKPKYWSSTEKDFWARVVVIKKKYLWKQGLNIDEGKSLRVKEDSGEGDKCVSYVALIETGDFINS